MSSLTAQLKKPTITNPRYEKLKDQNQLRVHRFLITSFFEAFPAVYGLFERVALVTPFEPDARYYPEILGELFPGCTEVYPASYRASFPSALRALTLRFQADEVRGPTRAGSDRMMVADQSQNLENTGYKMTSAGPCP